MIETVNNITLWVIISSLLQLISFVAVWFHALNRRRNASATILWIFVAWSFPLLGPLLYLCFGVDQISNKGFKKQITDQILMNEGKNQTHRSPITWHYAFQTEINRIESPLSQGLNKTITAMRPELPLLDGNHIIPLIDGDEAFPQMIKAINEAKHHIHLQSFIFSNDATGKQFMNALRKQAEKGVTVRLMYDRFGSTQALLTGFFKKYRKITNLHIIGWTQANPLKRQFQINLRNHRKNLIIDGETAFFGGINISANNVSTPGKKAHRDYHFKTTGPIVHELQYSFFRDWFFMTEEPLKNLLTTEHFPPIPIKAEAKARIIDSGPTSQPGLVGELFFNAITMASRQILLVTPYFAPTTDILRALRSAARKSIDVRIIVPAENNHIYAGYASKALYEELLEAGVQIFERAPPFIHAKALLVDSQIALVGTANLDVRSIELNYETTVLIDDEVFINKMKRIIHEDLDQSCEIDLNTWKKRPRSQRFGENICALMTPVL